MELLKRLSVFGGKFFKKAKVVLRFEEVKVESCRTTKCRLIVDINILKVNILKYTFFFVLYFEN